MDSAVNKLQAFKDYVHKRLDAAGIPVDPESPHKAEGCRIGGRLDHVFARQADLVTACRAALSAAKYDWHEAIERGWRQVAEQRFELITQLETALINAGVTP